MSTRVIAEFQKNSVEFVRVCLSEFKGSYYFDVRIWVQEAAGEPGNLKATKKGLCLNIELLDDLKRALEALDRAIEEGKDDEAKSDLFEMP
jgi:hypothetical protein